MTSSSWLQLIGQKWAHDSSWANQVLLPVMCGIHNSHCRGSWKQWGNHLMCQKDRWNQTRENEIEMWSTVPEKIQDERLSGSRESKIHRQGDCSVSWWLPGQWSLYPCKNILFLFRPSWSLILASGRILIKILRMVKSQAIESLISSSSKSHPPGWLWGRWVLEGPVASSRREEGNPESKANEEMYRLKAYSLCPRPSRIWNPKPGDSSHSVTPIMAILH